MALTEETVIDKIEILQDGQLQVRKARVIYDDGKEISRTYHREVLDPAHDQEKIAEQDSRVQDVANLVWTPKTIDARKAALRSSGDNESKLIV